MSGFTGKTDTELARTISGDGFYPALSFGDFQRTYRVPAEYHANLVENELTLAAAEIASQLNTQRIAWELLGYTTLGAVATAEDRDVNTWYFRAVYAQAKAKLMRQFATMSKRAVANNAAKELPETENYYLAQSNVAVRRVLGLPKMTAELL